MSDNEPTTEPSREEPAREEPREAAGHSESPASASPAASPTAVAAPPPRPAPASPKPRKRKRRRSHATLKRINRRSVSWTIAIFCGLLLAVEGCSQAQIQLAMFRASNGEYESALQTIRGVGFPVLRRGAMERLEREGVFHTEVEHVRNAVEVRHWFVAERALTKACAQGSDFESFPGELLEVLDAWYAQLVQLEEAGDLLKCKAALDALGRVPAEDPAIFQKIDAHALAVARKLADSLGDQAAWTAALEEVKRARGLSLPELEVNRLLDSIHKKMLAAVDEAVAAGDYDKAQGLSRLIKSRFADRTKTPQPSVEKIRVDEVLALARRLESQEEFDHAIEAYDQALALSQGKQEVYRRLRSLRERLEAYEKEDGQWVRQGARWGGGDLSEVSQHYRGWMKRPLLIDGRPNFLRKQPLARYSVDGTWSLVLERDGAEETWVVRGRVYLKQSYSTKAATNVRVGAAILGNRYRLLNGELTRIPYLIEGDSHDFEIRLPRHVEEEQIAVGVVWDR